MRICGLQLTFCGLFGAVCISGSALAQTLPLPASGVWNSFNKHLNVLECANGADSAYGIAVSVKSNQGLITASKHLSLPASGGSHLVLDPWLPQNSYGTVVIEHDSGTPRSDSPLNCATVVYRPSQPGATRAVDYAFALPIRSALKGATSGIYNSMSPNSTAAPVANWLTIYNPGQQAFSAEVPVYDSNGVKNELESFYLDQLQPGERRDFALGHPHGHSVGLFRIVPADSAQDYGSFVTRYSQATDGTFEFAFPVIATAGSESPGAVPVSTMDPAINWGEIANPGEDPVWAAIEVRDVFGNLKHSETNLLQPHAQYHLAMNPILSARSMGTFSARSLTAGGKLLVQSTFYGYRNLVQPIVEWAYVSQASDVRAEESDRMSFLLNTHLGAANWNKYLDGSRAPSSLNVSMFDTAGRSVERVNKLVSAEGSIDFPVHERVGANFVGQALAYTNTQTASLGTEMLRVYSDTRGGLGYIFNLPGRVIGPTARQQGPVRQFKGGHFLEFRGQKMIVIGESVTQGWMELGSDFNTTAYLDNLQSHGVNAFMIWSFMAIVDQSQDDRIGYHAPRRWPWQEVSGRVTPPYSFEWVEPSGEAKFNENYFAALQDLVRQANERDITVLITIHDGWIKDRFAGHPFAAANGGALTDRSQYVDLGDYSHEMPKRWNSFWTAQQRHQYLLERFSDRLIRATADYPNVMYEIFNEGEWYDQTKLRQFQVHFLDFFKSRTDAPLIVNDDGVGGAPFLEEPRTDFISLHQPKWNASTIAKAPFEYYSERFLNQNPLKRPLLFDEPVPEYKGDSSVRTALMRLMWGTLLGGAGYYMPNDSNWKLNADSTPDPIYLFYRYAIDFFVGADIAFEQMLPNGNLSSSGVCLASLGTEYICYIEGGGESGLNFSMNLQDASGNFSVKYYSPRAGTYFPGDFSVTAGGPTTVLTKPSIDDWVVWIKRTG